MIETAIDGLKIIPLKKYQDERGMVLKMLSIKSKYYERFGEIYFSYTKPGIIKGWKLHEIMQQNFVVPVGHIYFVFYDERKNSKSFGKVAKVDLCIDNYSLLKVPNKIWYSFKCISSNTAMIVNCSSIPHDPDEIKTCTINDCKIPFNWT